MYLHVINLQPFHWDQETSIYASRFLAGNSHRLANRHFQYEPGKHLYCVRRVSDFFVCPSNILPLVFPYSKKTDRTNHNGHWRPHFGSYWTPPRIHLCDYRSLHFGTGRLPVPRIGPCFWTTHPFADCLHDLLGYFPNPWSFVDPAWSHDHSFWQPEHARNH